MEEQATFARQPELHGLTRSWFRPRRISIYLLFYC